MGEFFKGWRRKAGLVMLVLAMFVTFGWMRSYIIGDAIFLRQHRTERVLSSLFGHVYWYKRELSEPIGLSIFWHTAETAYLRELNLNKDQVLPSNAVPYWSLILPLTLLSAWLILAKPRKVKPATGTTP